jgi:hypothetical protein
MALTGIKIAGLTSSTTVASTDLFAIADPAVSTKSITYANLATALGTTLGSSNLLTTEGDLLTHNGTIPARLAAGTDAQYLTISSGAITWSTFPDILTNPTTQSGDLIVRGATALERTGIGSEGQVLTVSSGVPAWSTLSLYIDPLTTDGDMLFRNSSSTQRLAAGTEGDSLVMVGGVPAWTNLAAYSDPLNVNGDIAIRSAGITSRLAIGTEGQVLTVVSGAASWATTSSYTDPLTTNGDLLLYTSGATTRLGKGTNGQVLTMTSGAVGWSDTSASLTDPTTQNGDLLIRTGGSLDRLAVGTEGQVLTVSSGATVWASAGSTGLTTDGDLLIVTSGATDRLPVGTDGQVLTVVSGETAWATVASSGDVFKTGTPSTNQVMVWDSDGVVRLGSANLTYTGTTFAIAGDLDVDNINLDGNIITTSSGDLTLSGASTEVNLTADTVNFVGTSGTGFYMPLKITSIDSSETNISWYNIPANDSGSNIGIIKLEEVALDGKLTITLDGDAGVPIDYVTIDHSTTTMTLLNSTITSPTIVSPTITNPTITGASITETSWTTLPLVNGWAAKSGSTPQYRIDSLGYVRFRGIVDGASKSSDTFVSALPDAYQPKGGFTKVGFSCAITASNDSKKVEVSYGASNTGTMIAFGVDASSEIYLDNIIYDPTTF